MPSNLLCPLSGMRQCTNLCAWHVDGVCAFKAIAQSLVALKADELSEEPESATAAGDCPNCKIGVMKTTVYRESNTFSKSNIGYVAVNVCPECGFRMEKHFDDMPLGGNPFDV